MRYFLIVLGVLFFGALLLDKFVLVSSAQEKETRTKDDSYICTHIHEYPIEQHRAILDYCKGLMERGL